MKIKEILDILNFNKKYLLDKTCKIEDFISIRQIITLLDYITNLQEENKNLHIQLEDKANEQIKTMYLEYKQRNEKAIQYINAGKTFDFIDVGKVVNKIQNDLLNILQGEDKDE